MQKRDPVICWGERRLARPTFHSIAEPLTHGLQGLTSGGLLENSIRCEAALKIICGAADLLDYRVESETVGSG